MMMMMMMTTDLVSEASDGNDKTEGGEAEGDEGEGVPLLDRGQGDAVQTLQKVHRTCFRNFFICVSMRPSVVLFQSQLIITESASEEQTAEHFRDEGIARVENLSTKSTEV